MKRMNSDLRSQARCSLLVHSYATPPPTRHWTTEWFRKVDLRRRGRVLVTDEKGTDGELAVATQAAAERRIHALESK